MLVMIYNSRLHITAEQIEQIQFGGLKAKLPIERLILNSPDQEPIQSEKCYIDLYYAMIRGKLDLIFNFFYKFRGKILPNDPDFTISKIFSKLQYYCRNGRSKPLTFEPNSPFITYTNGYRTVYGNQQNLTKVSLTPAYTFGRNFVQFEVVQASQNAHFQIRVNDIGGEQQRSEMVMSLHWDNLLKENQRQDQKLLIGILLDQYTNHCSFYVNRQRTQQYDLQNTLYNIELSISHGDIITLPTQWILPELPKNTVIWNQAEESELLWTSLPTIKVSQVLDQVLLETDLINQRFLDCKDELKLPRNVVAEYYPYQVSPESLLSIYNLLCIQNEVQKKFVNRTRLLLRTLLVHLYVLDNLEIELGICEQPINGFNILQGDNEFNKRELIIDGQKIERNSNNFLIYQQAQQAYDQSNIENQNTIYPSALFKQIYEKLNSIVNHQNHQELSQLASECMAVGFKLFYPTIDEQMQFLASCLDQQDNSVCSRIINKCSDFIVLSNLVLNCSEEQLVSFQENVVQVLYQQKSKQQEMNFEGNGSSFKGKTLLWTFMKCLLVLYPQNNQRYNLPLMNLLRELIANGRSLLEFDEPQNAQILFDALKEIGMFEIKLLALSIANYELSPEVLKEILPQLNEFHTLVKQLQIKGKDRLVVNEVMKVEQNTPCMPNSKQTHTVQCDDKILKAGFKLSHTSNIPEGVKLCVKCRGWESFNLTYDLQEIETPEDIEIYFDALGHKNCTYTVEIYLEKEIIGEITRRKNELLLIIENFACTIAVNLVKPQQLNTETFQKAQIRKGISDRLWLKLDILQPVNQGLIDLELYMRQRINVEKSFKDYQFQQYQQYLNLLKAPPPPPKNQYEQLLADPSPLLEKFTELINNDEFDRISLKLFILITYLRSQDSVMGQNPSADIQLTVKETIQIMKGLRKAYRQYTDLAEVIKVTELKLEMLFYSKFIEKEKGRISGKQLYQNMTIYSQEEQKVLPALGDLDRNGEPSDKEALEQILSFLLSSDSYTNIVSNSNTLNELSIKRYIGLMLFTYAFNHFDNHWLIAESYIQAVGGANIKSGIEGADYFLQQSVVAMFYNSLVTIFEVLEDVMRNSSSLISEKIYPVVLKLLAAVCIQINDQDVENFNLPYIRIFKQLLTLTRKQIRNTMEPQLDYSKCITDFKLSRLPLINYLKLDESTYILPIYGGTKRIISSVKISPNENMIKISNRLTYGDEQNFLWASYDNGNQALSKISIDNMGEIQFEYVDVLSLRYLLDYNKFKYKIDMIANCAFKVFKIYFYGLARLQIANSQHVQGMVFKFLQTLLQNDFEKSLNVEMEIQKAVKGKEWEGNVDNSLLLRFAQSFENTSHEKLCKAYVLAQAQQDNMSEPIPTNYLAVLHLKYICSDHPLISNAVNCYLEIDIYNSGKPLRINDMQLYDMIPQLQAHINQNRKFDLFNFIKTTLEAENSLLSKHPFIQQLPFSMSTPIKFEQYEDPAHILQGMLAYNPPIIQLLIDNNGSIDPNLALLYLHEIKPEWINYYGQFDAYAYINNLNQNGELTHLSQDIKQILQNLPPDTLLIKNQASKMLSVPFVRSFL